MIPAQKRRSAPPSRDSAEHAEQFEGFVAGLLNGLHIPSVEWNVVYTKDDGSRRQVDVQFRRGLFNSLVLVECKHRRDKYAHVGLYDFRDDFKNVRISKGRAGEGERHEDNYRQKKGLQKRIDHLIDEIDERRLYVRARYSVLVTNAYFGNDVIYEAGRQRIELWDRDTLLELLRKKHSLFGIEGLCWKRGFDLEAMICRTSEREYAPLKAGPYHI